MKFTARGVLAALLVLAVAAVCVRLGFWQLERLEQRRARNAAIVEALRLPVLELTPATAAALMREPEAWLNRRVRARGSYAMGDDVVLRGRAFQGRPGVHVVTPLRLGRGDTVVLVNRGWAPAADAATVDRTALAEPGVHTVEGILQAVPRPGVAGSGVRPNDARAASGGGLRLRRLDLDLLRGRTDAALLPLYVQQLPDGAAARAEPPLRVPLPELDEGPHLGYAVQWFGFAAIALFGSLFVAAHRRRNPS